MEKINVEQQERADYRLAVLHYKLQRIEDNVTGRGKSYLPGITDESGVINDEKLNGFINDMLESLDHYIEMRSNRAIDEKTRGMYRRFLYLAVKTLKDRPNMRCPSVEITECAKTFGDIIDAAENVDIPDCRSYYDFLKILYDKYRGKRVYLPQLIGWAQEGLKYLGLAIFEEAFIENLPRNMRLQLYNEYIKENGTSDDDDHFYHLADDPKGYIDGYLKYQEEQAEQDDTPPEVVDSMVEKLAEKYYKEQEEKAPFLNALKALDETQTYGENEVLKDLTLKEITDYEYEAAFNEQIDSTIPYWSGKIVVDHEAYFNNYIEFVKLYFGNDHSMLCEDITNMVDTYLFEHGISAFSYGDRYGLVSYQIEKAQKRISAEIERAKNYERIQK